MNNRVDDFKSKFNNFFDSYILSFVYYSELNNSINTRIVELLISYYPFFRDANDAPLQMQLKLIDVKTVHYEQQENIDSNYTSEGFFVDKIRDYYVFDFNPSDDGINLIENEDSKFKILCKDFEYVKL